MTGPRAFGESLKRQREAQGIALSDVAGRTKIGAGFLAALERGDCARWPAGIYSRAWIRAYAAAVGLDPDETSARFVRCFPRSAFLEGDAAALSAPPPAGIQASAPLRLTLEPDPHLRARQVQQRAGLLAADLLLAVAAAAAAAALVSVDFWKVLAAASVLIHAAGLFGGGSAVGCAWRQIRALSTAGRDQISDPVSEAGRG